MPTNLAVKTPLKRRSSRLLCALVLASLSACAVGPDQKTPALAIAASFQNAPALKDQVANAPRPELSRFWEGFNDPVLSRLIERALADNFDLAIADARVSQSRALARQADAVLWPSGSASFGAVKEKQSLEDPIARLASHEPGYSREQNLYNLGVGASWDADVFGANGRAAEVAGHRYAASQAERHAVQIVVVTETADAYFRLRGANNRIAAIEDEVRVNSDLLDLVDLRLEQGLGTDRERAEAEAVLYQTRALLPPLRLEAALEASRLDVLQGRAPGGVPAELQGAAPIATLPLIKADEGPVDLLRRRPDVIAAEQRLAAANGSIAVATAQYYPQFSFSALVGSEAYRSADLFKGLAFQPQALFGMRWRLFDFGRVDAEVDQAKGAYAEALLDYRRSMVNATADVENAIVRLVQSEAREAALAHQSDAEERARRSAEEAFKGGAAGLYEVLEEERQLIAVKDQLQEAQAADAVAVVDTFKALGGGW